MKVSKTNRTLLKIGIIFVALNDSGTGATTPALGSIAAGLPLVAPWLIQMIATVPALFQALLPPIYGASVGTVRKKTWLIIAGICFVVGGAAPAFFHDSIWVILFFRAILGIGCGVLVPMATDLCVDFFEGNEQRTMIGFTSAFVGASGVIFQMLGGYLAGIRWDYTFYAYLISIVFLGIAIVLLPEPDREAKLKADVKSNVSTKLNLGTYLYALTILLFFFFWYTPITNVAMVIMSEKIAEPAAIGGVFSFMTGGAFVTALIFGQLFKKLRYAILPIAYAFGAIGLYLLYTGHTLTILTVGMVLLGFSLGFVVPCTMSKLTALVPYSAASKAISLGFFGVGFGGFIQPMAFGLFMGVGRGQILVGCIGMTVLTVVLIILEKAFPTKDTAEGNNVAA